MARRPAARPTSGETRPTTTNGHNPEASSADVGNSATGTRISPLELKFEALQFHRLVQVNKGIVGHNAFRAVMLDYTRHGLPLPEMVRRVTVLFKDDHDLLLGFNRFLPPMAQIPLPIRNLRRVRIFGPTGDDEQ